MTPSRVLVLAISALGLMFAAPTGMSSSTPAADVVIRVTSATPGHEVQVEGAYVYVPQGSDLHHIRRATPFEIKERAGVLVGIFSSNSADSQIHVEMVSQGAQSGKSTATATGLAVTVTTDEHRGGSVIRSL